MGRPRTRFRSRKKVDEAVGEILGDGEVRRWLSVQVLEYEKRFSQFKTDNVVAPVYLKEVTCIQSMLAVYFFALMMQTLLERELRNALADSEYDSLPLYPERRDCHTPTTRRFIDIFETVQRHQLTGGGASQTFVPQLSPLQKQIAKWFDVRPNQYGH